MGIRIVRPLPPEIEGFDLSHLRFGESYEINQPLSDLLLVTGYGVPEDEPPMCPALVLKALATAIVAGDGRSRTKGKAAPKPIGPKQSKPRRKRSRPR